MGGVQHSDFYHRRIHDGCLYVTLKMARNDDGYTIRSFFKSFKENFKQSTIIWLLLLLAGIILGIDLWFFAKVFNLSLIHISTGGTA